MSRRLPTAALIATGLLLTACAPLPTVLPGPAPMDARRPAGETPRPRVESAAALPPTAYRFDRPLVEVLRSADAFGAFAQQLRRDTEAVLRSHDIVDKPTRANLVAVLATLDVLEGRHASALARVETLRELQVLPADRHLAGLQLRAMAQAGMKVGGPGAVGFEQAVAQAMAEELARMPRSAVLTGLQQARASVEALEEGRILAAVAQGLQPRVDDQGRLAGDHASGLMSARYALVAVLPLRNTLLQAYAQYLGS